MSRPTSPADAALALSLAGAGLAARAQEGDAAMLPAPIAADLPAPAVRTPAIVAAADAFMATLSAQQRDAALFDWTDQTQRVNWSNFPLGGPGANRQGVTWGDMNEPQRVSLMEF